MIDSSNVFVYTHDMLLEGINEISQKVLDSEVKFDYIVGISRGGTVPAVYLSHKLKLPVTFIEWSSRDLHLANGNSIKPEIIEDYRQGKKILIVDDIIDGGDTIEEIVGELTAQGVHFSSVFIASLVYNENQPMWSHYYHKKINRDTDTEWLVFPWEN